MQTVFLGNMKKLFQPVKSDESFSMRLLENLRFSNLGLCKSQVKPSSPMDAFEITKNLSELLSPACGMTDEEKTAYLNRIMAKLKSGKKLTAEEMRFLQAEDPTLYQQAARVQAMRDGLEQRLKSCRSKEEAQTIFANAMDSVSDKDPMKEYIVAAYQDVMEEFQKSDEYKELPDTEEEAKERKKCVNVNLEFKYDMEEDCCKIEIE